MCLISLSSVDWGLSDRMFRETLSGFAGIYILKNCKKKKEEKTGGFAKKSYIDISFPL